MTYGTMSKTLNNKGQKGAKKEKGKEEKGKAKVKGTTMAKKAMSLPHSRSISTHRLDSEATMSKPNLLFAIQFLQSLLQHLRSSYHGHGGSRSGAFGLPAQAFTAQGA